MLQNNPYQAPASDVGANETAIIYAGFWLRVLASMIDAVLIVAVTWPLLMLIYGTDYLLSEAFFQGVWDLLINYVFPAVAVILFWLNRGATPGKMAIGARIVDARTGDKLTTGQCVGRYFAYILSALPLLLGYIWVGVDERKQGWHDKLAGTVVIRTRKESTPVSFPG